MQKSNRAARRGEVTRADRIATSCSTSSSCIDPPLEDEQTGLRIRRARPDESRLLTRLERAASEAALAHLFPPEEYPYPVDGGAAALAPAAARPAARRLHPRAERRSRWAMSRSTTDTVQHLGVLADQHAPRLRLRAAGVRQPGDVLRRRARGVAVGAERQRGAPAPSTARTAGPRPTTGARSEFPPFPEEIRMVRTQPVRARGAADERGRPSPGVTAGQRRSVAGQGVLLTVAGLCAGAGAGQRPCCGWCRRPTTRPRSLASFIAYGRARVRGRPGLPAGRPGPRPPPGRAGLRSPGWWPC